MALTLPFTTATGLTCDAAYVRVEHVMATKSKANVQACWYAKPSGYPCLQSSTHSFDYDLNGENLIKQAYLHLKTLPEFAYAIDC